MDSAKAQHISITPEHTEYCKQRITATEKYPLQVNHWEKGAVTSGIGLSLSPSTSGSSHHHETTRGHMSDVPLPNSWPSYTLPQPSGLSHFLPILPWPHRPQCPQADRFSCRELGAVDKGARVISWEKLGDRDPETGSQKLGENAGADCFCFLLKLAIDKTDFHSCGEYPC